MADVELKPCPNPWCGSDPFAWRHPRGFYAVSCASCELSGPNKPTETEAVAEWNTRTNDQAKDEEIARLREALERAADWFGEYAHTHGEKAMHAATEQESQSRIAKCQRNAERERDLRQALGASFA